MTRFRRGRSYPSIRPCTGKISQAGRSDLARHDLHGGRNSRRATACPKPGLPKASARPGRSSSSSYLRQRPGGGDTLVSRPLARYPRLNVYGELAGFYLLRDDNEQGLISS